MIGMQRSHIQQHGKRLVSIILCFCLLCLGGCTGSSDLYYSLPNGYAVTRINGSQIVIIYNNDWRSEQGQEWDGRIVLTNYFVKGFCYNESYIGLFGTRTEASSATSQEITSGAIQYYLIDSRTREILGPYATQEDFNKACTSSNAGVFDSWYEVADYPDKWTSSYK